MDLVGQHHQMDHHEDKDTSFLPATATPVTRERGVLPINRAAGVTAIHVNNNKQTVQRTWEPENQL